MRHAALVLLIASACGPGRRADVPPPSVDDGPRAYDPDDKRTWTDADWYASAVKLDTITCPPGTTQVGDAPPTGTYAYCELPDGERHGPWMTWPSYGNPRKIAINDHGKGQSWTAWHLSNDALEIIAEMRDDQFEGRMLRWHDNGQLAFDGRYMADHPEGWCRAWDRDGTLLFDEDLPASGGRLVTWDGPLRVEEHWSRGALDGPRTVRYPDGQVESVTVYVDGEAGDHDAWHRNGRKAKEIRGGRHTEWDEAGNEVPEMCAHGPCDLMPE